MQVRGRYFAAVRGEKDLLLALSRATFDLKPNVGAVQVMGICVYEPRRLDAHIMQEPGSPEDIDNYVTGLAQGDQAQTFRISFPSNVVIVVFFSSFLTRLISALFTPCFDFDNKKVSLSRNTVEVVTDDLDILWPTHCL